MPRQDGIVILKILKKDNKLCSIPIMMINTLDTSPEIKDCYSLVAYLHHQVFTVR